MGMCLASVLIRGKNLAGDNRRPTVLHVGKSKLVGFPRLRAWSYLQRNPKPETADYDAPRRSLAVEISRSMAHELAHTLFGVSLDQGEELEIVLRTPFTVSTAQ